jgi:hypothetical protein
MFDLGPGGVVGREENDLPLIDVHHQNHLMSKNCEGEFTRFTMQFTPAANALPPVVVLLSPGR